jgi:hypothetical protein
MRAGEGVSSVDLLLFSVIIELLRRFSSFLIRGSLLLVVVDTMYIYVIRGRKNQRYSVILPLRCCGRVGYF